MGKACLYFWSAFFEALIFLGTTIFATLLAIHWNDEVNNLFYTWLILPVVAIGFKTWIDYMIDNERLYR